MNGNTLFEQQVPAVIEKRKELSYTNDDLFASFDEKRKNNFLNNLDSFLSDAEAALKEQNQLKASRLWQKHLGARFPDGEDKDEQSNSSAATTSGAALSRPWGK